MSKIKSVIAGLGAVTALGVAVAPLAAYADEVTNPNTVTAVIAPVLSMRMVSSGSTGDKTLTCDSNNNPVCSGQDQVASTTILPGQADTSSMYTDIYVSTNVLAGFTLTLKDSDNNNNLQTTGGDTIAPISSEPVGSTNPGWAVKIDDGSTWYAVPAANAGSSVSVKNHQPSPAAVSVDVHSKVTYGVAASSSQATGIYRDTVTYTATTL